MASASWRRGAKGAVNAAAEAATSTATTRQPSRSLPKIEAYIGHIPQRLKTSGIEPNRRARLEVLRKIVSRMVREERAEFQYNRAVEARPYLERLIQLSVENGQKDEYTAEMVEWWLPEAGLPYKLYEVIAPRFVDAPQPFTAIYRLPSQRLQQYIQNKRVFWKRYDIAVLEIKGNPYPPVTPPEASSTSHLLVNQLLKKSLEVRLRAAESAEKN